MFHTATSNIGISSAQLAYTERMWGGVCALIKLQRKLPVHKIQTCFKLDRELQEQKLPFFLWYVNAAVYIKIKIYKTIILPVILYGCETSSLTLREERKLRVFENKVLRRIFGPRRDEVTGE